MKLLTPGNTTLRLGPWVSGPAMPLDELLDELDELELEEELELELLLAAGAEFYFVPAAACEGEADQYR